MATSKINVNRGIYHIYKAYRDISGDDTATGYYKLDSITTLDANVDSTWYIISAIIRGFESVANYPLSIAKGGNGLDIYLLSPKQISIGSVGVEYFLVHSVDYSKSY